MDTTRIQNEALDPIRSILRELQLDSEDALANGLSPLLARIHSYGVFPYFRISSSIDSKSPQQYSLRISQGLSPTFTLYLGGTLLPKPMYLDTALMETYLETLDHILSLILPSLLNVTLDFGESLRIARSVLNFEIAIAAFSDKEEDLHGSHSRTS